MTTNDTSPAPAVIDLAVPRHSSVNTLASCPSHLLTATNSTAGVPTNLDYVSCIHMFFEQVWTVRNKSIMWIATCLNDGIYAVSRLI